MTMPFPQLSPRRLGTQIGKEQEKAFADQREVKADGEEEKDTDGTIQQEAEPCLLSAECLSASGGGRLSGKAQTCAQSSEQLYVR